LFWRFGGLTFRSGSLRSFSGNLLHDDTRRLDAEDNLVLWRQQRNVSRRFEGAGMARGIEVAHVADVQFQRIGQVGRQRLDFGVVQ
jgi:hypothetical protein